MLKDMHNTLHSFVPALTNQILMLETSNVGRECLLAQ